MKNNFLLLINKLFNRTLTHKFFTGGFIWAKCLSKINKPRGILFLIYRALSGKFRIQNNKYSYFYRKYNNTWNNERAVEIPIIWEIVNRYKNKDILEVGNVLSHYFSINHNIVDKYEIADYVINVDVVGYHPNKNYDLIISISTLEHIGWDEIPKDPIKILTAINNLLTILKKNGKIIITLPVGLNPYLDKLLRENKISFYKRICLKRVSRSNIWREANWEEIKDARLDFPFNDANGLLILFIKN